MTVIEIGQLSGVGRATICGCLAHLGVPTGGGVRLTLPTLSVSCCSLTQCLPQLVSRACMEGGLVFDNAANYRTAICEIVG